MPKKAATPRGAFALSDDPKNPLYKRCADALCAMCTEPIEEKPFRLAFSEWYGYELVIHHGCLEAFEGKEEDPSVGWSH